MNNDKGFVDAYQSIYEHHQKDENGNTIPHEDDVKEGKIPAGLQAYLDKKKGKKKDDDGDEKKDKKDKKDMKEAAGLYANIHAKRKRGGKMRKKGDEGAPSKQDFANAAKTAKEDFEKYDLVYNHFIEEGFSEEETYERMSNLTEKQLDEFVQSIPVLLGKIGMTAKGAGLAKGATAAAKGAKVTTSGGKVVSGASKLPQKKPFDLEKNMYRAQTANNMLSSGGGGGSQKQRTGTVSASADLFDIVKGQLIDEGLSEEEIKDIMLELTPEEILKELEESSLSAGSSGGNYSDGGDGVFRSKEQVGSQFNKNFPPAKNGKVDKRTRKAINTSARDFGIQGPTTLKQSVEPEGETI